MSYNALNYTEQGGDVTHIGGKLVFEEGSCVEGLPAPSYEIPEDSTATTVAGLKEDFNALLAVLKGTAAEAEAEPEQQTPDPDPDPEQQTPDPDPDPDPEPGNTETPAGGEGT